MSIPEIGSIGTTSNEAIETSTIDALMLRFTTAIVYEVESQNQNTRIRLPDGRRMEPQPMEESEEELGDDDMATVRLDSGETVQIPAKFLQPGEPESEVGSDEDAPMLEPSPDAETPTPGGGIDPTLNQATGARISDGEFRMLETVDRVKVRACLRARQHLQRLEHEWWSADQRGDTDMKMKIYQEMDKHYPYLDCRAFPEN